MLDEIFNNHLKKYTRFNDEQVTTVPLQQLEGLAWHIQFIDNKELEPDDIIWNRHQFALVADIGQSVKLTFALKAQKDEFAEAWVHTRGQISDYTLDCLFYKAPLINIEGVAWRYPELDIPIQHQRRLLAIYILNLQPGDVIEVVTSPVDSINTDWHAREFSSLIPITQIKGRRGCLSLTKTHESSAAAEAILMNRVFDSVVEPHPSTFRGQLHSPLNDPRITITDDRWLQFQQQNHQVEFSDGQAFPYIHWRQLWNGWRPGLVKERPPINEDEDYQDNIEVEEQLQHLPVEE